MSTLKIDKTDSSVGVILNSETHELSFIGESRPENVRAFFLPIIDWITAYGRELTDKLATENQIDCNATFQLEYFNSSSAKCIVDILLALQKIRSISPKIKLSINWKYEQDDDDLLEAGQEFVRLTGIDMNFIEV